MLLCVEPVLKRAIEKCHKKHVVYSVHQSANNIRFAYGAKQIFIKLAELSFFFESFSLVSSPL